MKPKRWLSVVLSICGALLSPALSAQITPADYERAANLRARYRGLALNVPDSPTWVKGTNRLWYRKTVDRGYAFVVVDAQTATRKPAFDHDKMAAAVSTATGEKYNAATLPFWPFKLNDDGTAIDFPLKGAHWSCDVSKYTCANLGPLKRGDPGFRDPDEDEYGDNVSRWPRSVPSPDGKWEALLQNYNVYLRLKTSADPGKSGAGESGAGGPAPRRQSEAFPLSWDGSEGNYYRGASMWWSPDSRYLVAYRVRPGYRRQIHYIESSPEDQLQPKYSSFEYPKPGDAVSLPQPVLFDTVTKRQIDIGPALFPNPYELSDVEWRKDSRAFTFEYNQRGHQVYRVVEVAAATGAARSLITEESETFINYQRLVPNQHETGKIYRYDVRDGKEIIWMSERDGWAHLYLYDGVTGKLKNQITKGNWVVRGVDHVDEDRRQIWFYASGMYPGKDPYFLHAYRINFDGTGLTAFAEADGNHQVAYSSDGKYYVDIWSRVDEPPVMELRRTEDKARITELERADISKLVAAGWRPPEVFSAVGRDGKTDIWGVIYRPANFDAAKRYPVVESIYAGPQGSFVPKSFSAMAEPLTELGFVVAHIDGMGTNNRSRAFHDVAWKNLKDGGFEDRILWHKAAAAKYPSYDISRVGIYGNSAGGQNALAGLLFHPEFYQAGVASCGSHDNRIDKMWWNEQFMGWPIGPPYAASSNVDNAYRLQGKLLLIVGEMDKNVDPAATLQVVNALIRANKKFDLLFLPGGGHGMGGAYGERALTDFFVHNLLGVEPPEWNRQSNSGKAND